jgi:hypothetical protein
VDGPLGRRPRPGVRGQLDSAAPQVLYGEQMVPQLSHGQRIEDRFCEKPGALFQLVREDPARVIRREDR